jgi:NADH-quinone oxidoreductase subunit G
MKQIVITINGQTYTIPEGTTLLNACKKAGFEIPMFCAHDKLSVAGNCRMCLVEVVGNHKMVASCAMPVSDGMVVLTESDKVKKSRKGNLELLLINHPLDCPVCDQAGECDLQDITMAYGPSTTRFAENKREVPDKYMGPLIKTIMNRCIHCMRCVRFATEVAGVEELGSVGRGEDLAITTYLDKAMTSPLSGNVIDLCPVGALNAKPSTCKGRSWEYEKTPSIDITDALGSAIEIHTKDSQIVRILPRTNDDVNEEWLTDKARFSYDGLRYQRLDTPYIRRQGKLMKATWLEAFQTVAAKIKDLKPQEIGALSGDLMEVESLFALRQLLDTLGVKNRDCRERGVSFSIKDPSDYLFNTSLRDLETADACLLIGTNPEVECPLMNVRLRRAVKKGCVVGLIGPEADLGYPHTLLSIKATVLNKIAEDDHAFADILKNAKRPLIIVGTGALQDLDGLATYQTARFIADAFGVVKEGWNGFNVLPLSASRIGALSVGCVPDKGGDDTDRMLRSAEQGKLKFLYLLGRDDVTRDEVGNAFVVYQGHHGDQGAQMADLILPGVAYTEKQGLYMNMEGCVQETAIVIKTPGEAKEDWKIIRALSEMVGHALPYDTREELLEALYQERPFFKVRGIRPQTTWHKTAQPKEIRRGLLEYPLKNFHRTDVISRASPTMAECVRSYKP